MQLRGILLAGAMLAMPVGAQAAADAGVAKEILKRSVAFKTVEGAGQVPALAAYYASVLKQAGFADADIVITPMGETATLAATIKGRDPSLKPMLMIGHMDVVAANRADWTRDPFVPVEEDGYIFGRGSEDNKYDVAMMVATLAQHTLKVPRVVRLQSLSGAGQIKVVQARDPEAQCSSAQHGFHAG